MTNLMELSNLQQLQYKRSCSRLIQAAAYFRSYKWPLYSVKFIARKIPLHESQLLFRSHFFPFGRLFVCMNDIIVVK